jgi:hypothetical protein
MFSPVVALPDEDARDDALDLGTDTMQVIQARISGVNQAVTPVDGAENRSQCKTHDAGGAEVIGWAS